MPGFQSPITICNAIERINRNEFLLPAFQREFVWSALQIEKLFDSLMKGYPISSMLFWKVKGDTKTDFRFYKFLNKYIQHHSTHNDSLSTDSINDFHAILDGQQRLTSLYIGLCGSYAYKSRMKRWDYSESNFPTRHLYLNISRKLVNDKNDKTYNFLFLDKNQTLERDLYIDDNGDKWFRIRRILSLHKDEYDLDDFCEGNSIERDEKKIMKRLDKVIHTYLNINYYEEDDQIPDKAVNIFVRINSGGTHLTFSDILMSIAVANWKEKDARTEIHNLVDIVNSKGFKISKDYVLKSFLYLFHTNIVTTINSFNNGFCEKIENNWDKIRRCIESLFDLLKTYGVNDYSLTSYNATLPILYYIYHKDIYKDFDKKIEYKEDRQVIKKWLLTILLRKAFGASADNVLSQSRKAFTEDIESTYIINDLPLFPALKISSNIRNVGEIGEDYILELLNTPKDSRYSFPILAILYPDLDYKNNNFHQDHLHPWSKYEDLNDEFKEKYGEDVYNSILNLQMLDANENESKGALPLVDWVASQTRNCDKSKFLESHIIPNVNLESSNIIDFIEARRVLLTSKLKELLS